MNNNLFFYDAAAPAGVVVDAWRGTTPGKSFLISEYGQAGADWQRAGGGAVVPAHSSMLPSLLSESEPDTRRTFILDCADGAHLSRLLVQFRAARGVDVFAPRTDHYYKARPAFINSVPKCGTHLLSTCLEAMGLAPPPDDAMPDMAGAFDGGRYYNLQHMRVEDIADQYRKIGPFIDALSTSAIVFIGRDPRDAIVSLANYIPRQREYHILGRFMEKMTEEERIDTVILGTYPIPVFINDRYQLDDTIAALFASYERWRPERWRNLWRIRYEDLIGPKGLGTREAQLETIWGLQLALHVPGNPDVFAEKVFSENSPTFFRGTIGRHQTDLSAANHAALNSVSYGFINKAGYADRWQIDRSFRIRIEATERETAREAARALYCELSTRGRGDFHVVVDDEVDPSPPHAAVVSVRCKSREDAGEAHDADLHVHVSVSHGAAGMPRYRCAAALQDGAEEIEWASASIAKASERVVAFCAAQQLCAGIGGRGDIAAVAPDPAAQPRGGQGRIEGNAVDVASFSGSLSKRPVPPTPRRAGLTQLLRVSLSLLLNLT